MLTHPQMLVASPVFALSLFLEVEVLDTLLLASGVDVAFGVLVGVFVGCVVGIVVGAVVGVQHRSQRAIPLKLQFLHWDIRILASPGRNQQKSRLLLLQRPQP